MDGCCSVFTLHSSGLRTRQLLRVSSLGCSTDLPSPSRPPSAPVHHSPAQFWRRTGSLSTSQRLLSPARTLGNTSSGQINHTTPHHTTPDWPHMTRWCFSGGSESPQPGGSPYTPGPLRRRPSGFSSAASSFSSRGTSSSSRHRFSSHASDLRSSGSGPGSDHLSLSQQGSGVSSHSGRSNLRTPCRDLLSAFSSQSSLPSPGHSQDTAGNQRGFGSTGSLHSSSGLHGRELFRSQPDGSSEESDQQSRRQAPASQQVRCQLRDQKQTQSVSPVFIPQTIKDEAPTQRSPSPIKRVISPVKSKILRKSSSSSKFRSNSPSWETSERSQSTSPLSGEKHGGKLKGSQSQSSLRRNSVELKFPESGGQKKPSNVSGTKKKLGFPFMGHSTNQ